MLLIIINTKRYERFLEFFCFEPAVVKHDTDQQIVHLFAPITWIRKPPEVWLEKNGKHAFLVTMRDHR